MNKTIVIDMLIIKMGTIVRPWVVVSEVPEPSVKCIRKINSERVT